MDPIVMLLVTSSVIHLPILTEESFQYPETLSTMLGVILNQCEFIFPALDANGEYYQPDVGNIMSAYPCKCGFTREQYLKMAEVYFSSSVKQF